MRKVLISPGFGAGWSTWATDSLKEDMIFDEQLIAAVEALGPGEYLEEDDEVMQDFVKRMQEKHGEDIHICFGGADQLRVSEVDGPFIIEEYDGSEYIVSRDDTNWL